MSVRATSVGVGAIIELDADIDLTPFIGAANMIWNRVLAQYDAAGTNDYTEDELTTVETWLAAHFYTNRDPRVTSESAGVSASYQSAVTLGLSTSHYGQMAMTLDVLGGLAALNQQTLKGVTRKAKFAYLGTQDPDPTP